MGSSENRICHQNVMVHHGSSWFIIIFPVFFPCRPGRGRESSGRSAWPRCWKSWCLGHHAIYRLYELYIVVIWGHKPVINGISSLWGLASQGYLSVSHWDDHPSMSGVQKGTAIYWTLPRSSHRVCPKMMATFQKTLFSMKWSFLGKSRNFWLFATDINAVRFGTLPWLLIQGPLCLL